MTTIILPPPAFIAWMRGDRERTCPRCRETLLAPRRESVGKMYAQCPKCWLRVYVQVVEEGEIGVEVVA